MTSAAPRQISWNSMQYWKKCTLHMVANDQVQVVRNMSHRSYAILGLYLIIFFMKNKDLNIQAFPGRMMLWVSCCRRSVYTMVFELDDLWTSLLMLVKV